MKRVFGFFLATAAVLSLGACAPGGGAGEPAPAAGPAETASAASQPGDSPKELVLYTEALEGAPSGDFQRAQVKKFEEQNPGVTIEVMASTSQDFDTFFKTAVSGGEQIDIVQVNVQFFRDYVTKGYLKDLSGLVDLNKTPRMEMAWEQMKYFAMEDKIYGVPMSLATSGFYYSKEIFEKYGIEIPRTWDDIYAMKEKLAPDGIAPMVYAGAEPWWNPMHFNILFYQITENKGLEINDKFMRGDFSAQVVEPYVATLQFFADLDKNGIFIPGTQGMDLPSAINVFAQGKAAMYFSGTWFVDNLKQGAPDMDYGVFPVPVMKEGLKSQAAGSVGEIYSIYSKSENEQTAARFIEFFGGPDTMRAYSKEVGGFVNITLGSEGANENPVMADFEEIGPTTEIWLDAIWEPEIITDFQMGAQAAIVGDKTPQQVMDDIINHYGQLREQGKTFF